MNHMGSPLDELHGFYFNDLTIGMSDLYAKTITEADITLFAKVSGDTNPIHLNKNFANKTRYKGCIAHGILTAGLISTVIGTKMPGPGSIYISQILRFKAPVKIGDTVIATVTILKLVKKTKIALLKTVCKVNDRTVLDGEATVLVPNKVTA